MCFAEFYPLVSRDLRLAVRRISTDYNVSAIYFRRRSILRIPKHVSGGIFKETEVGAWVHLVCALYVPGVAFSEVS